MDNTEQHGIVESAVFKLHRATLLVDRVADRYLQEHHGMRYSAFLVLLTIGTVGQLTQRQIADNLDVSRASITQRLRRLLDDDLVTARPHPEDARANTISLSRKGAELLERAWRGLETHQDGVDEGVDVKALVLQLDRISDNALRVLNASAGERP
ncbi:MarR family winged helix-turn-helix transcriptional regulator [Arthrobacter sp. YAF34]|uniref:MarR family winged helix-turn-helix transcriptional regulator n=1 Tax=Arthrobacter sp. YAF34 TaxID=3233083 RepID=UPI003F90C1AA